MKRYTLSLPDKVYEEVFEFADKKEVSARDVVLQCLKVGLIALNVEDDSDKELILRERIKSDEPAETKLVLI